MTTDDPLKDMLIRHEGQVKVKANHVPYDDRTGARFDQGDTLVGKLTLGIGRNLSDRGITDDEAMCLLTNDIELVRNELNVALPWWIRESEARQAVMISLGFNLGVPKLLTFKTTLGLWEAGKYTEAADRLMTLPWAQQVGQRAVELTTMLRTGKWIVNA